MISAAPPAVGSAAISAPMKGAGPLDDDRSGHHDAGGHRDLQREAVPEYWLG
jgi:hypothetical protein